jgi:hypothetical protein
MISFFLSYAHIEVLEVIQCKRKPNKKKNQPKFVISELAGVSATADPNILPLGPVPEPRPLQWQDHLYSKRKRYKN